LCASRGKLYTMKIKVDSTWSPERSCWTCDNIE
jgi:hypothetical protein